MIYICRCCNKYVRYINNNGYCDDCIDNEKFWNFDDSYTDLSIE